VTAVALVTGGASGIGAATCELLAAGGARVVVADVDEAGGAAVASRLGGLFVRCDVADLESCRGAVAFAVERCGGLDLVHLNAGVSTGCGVEEDFDPALYRRAVGVNLDGVVFGTHACLPALRARGGGAIVATASMAGLVGMSMDPVYTATKHAVVGLARALGPALAGEGIRFNAICPAFAETPIVEPIREQLLAAGFSLISAESVARGVLALFEGEMSGECWFVQAGREPEAFRFRGVPGPREVPAA
jgi:NAD(P)-dependent dehydrogenase (short-subunit alcohol dehydrogenase family)